MSHPSTHDAGKADEFERARCRDAATQRLDEDLLDGLRLVDEHVEVTGGQALGV